MKLALGDGTTISLAGEWKGKVAVDGRAPGVMPPGYETVTSMVSHTAASVSAFVSALANKTISIVGAIAGKPLVETTSETGGATIALNAGLINTASSEELKNMLLDALLAKGYKFVTVSELLALEQPATPTPSPTASPEAKPKKKSN